MFQRLKTIWRLSKIKNIQDADYLYASNSEEGKRIISVNEIPSEDNAVFFGEGTHDEFEDQQREDSGMKGWYDKIKNL